MNAKLVLCAAALLAFRAEAGDVTIPAGTVFYGTVSQPISTKDLAEGQTVTGFAQARDALVVKGETVVAAGAPVQLLVSALKKGRRARIGDEVTLTAMSRVAVDGATINLSGALDAKEDTKVAKDIGFGIVTPWTLLKKGAVATIPEARVFTITVPADTLVRVPDHK
jgi:hypothetical protein